MTRLTVLAALSLVAVAGGLTQGQDWPTYMHDNCRSGLTEAQLALPLELAWAFKPLKPPSPAWSGPAKQDYYHDHFDLRDVEAYDHAFHAIAAGGMVFFASASQDKVYALDAATGAVRWTFLAEGPIRFAPVFSEGRIYVGSDDGCMYCLSAGNGSIEWKRQVVPDARMIPGNGRMISLWPVRTGLIVDDGVVYCTAGLFPEQGTYLAALDARSGDLMYRQRLAISPQGYILASDHRLYVPTGRTNPAIFSREKGEPDGQLPSGGGAYAILTEDVLVTGPGRGEKQLQAGDLQTKDTVATFGGLRMLVSGSVAYMQSERQLAAFDRGRYLQLSRERTRLDRDRAALRKSLDKIPKDQPEAAGIQRRIDEINEQIRRLDVRMQACYLWSVACEHAHAMIMAGKVLFVGGEGEVAAIDGEDGAVVWRTPIDGRALGLSIASSSLYVSTDRGCVYCFAPSVAADAKRIVEEARADPYPEDELTKRYADAARHILPQLPSGAGYCLVLDCGEGRLACELARRGEFRIVGVESDAAVAEKARRLVDRAGLHGQVTIHHFPDGKLPYTSYFANVVVSDGMLRGEQYPADRAEILRLLRPYGGMLILGTPATAQSIRRMRRWGQDIFSEWKVVDDGGLTWGSFQRGGFDDAGEWTHMYAEPGNSACSGDRLVKGPLTLQWFGEPGPREMIDRHHRNIPPLFKNGRLFVPGDDVVFAVDPYNGAALWRIDVPNSRRLGAFLDGGSMVVDEESLYVAVQSGCRVYDVRDGRHRRTLAMPQPVSDAPREWGYLACQDSTLLGSGCKKDASYVETSHAADDALWYRNMQVVTSDYLFAKDKHDDRLLWTYQDGVVLNTTIAAAAGRVYFVETDCPRARADKIGRMPVKTLFAGGDQYLVGLDQTTGRTAFKKKIDVSHFEEPVYLNVAQGVLLLSGSRLVDKSIWYYYDAFAAATGEKLWHAEHKTSLAIDGGHGEYNRHPTIIGETIYAWPYAYVLQTGGRVADWEFDRRGHGCGGVSASAQCLFWRGSNPWMYDLGPQGGPARLNTVSRPGCWINMIPAGGLLLIPEASSGCTCGFSLQTSLAYIPQSVLE